MINSITETKRLLREIRRDLSMLHTVQLNNFYVGDSDIPMGYDEHNEYIKGLLDAIPIRVEDTEGKSYIIPRDDMLKFSNSVDRDAELGRLRRWEVVYTTDLHFGTIARDINKKYKLKCRGCGTPVKLVIDFYYMSRKDGTPYAIQGKVYCNKCKSSYASKRMDIGHYSSSTDKNGYPYYAYKDIGEKDLVHMWDDYIKEV